MQVAFYGASLILALDFLHARGVLHRDIKVGPTDRLIGVDG